jgi:hypothetical protein
MKDHNLISLERLSLYCHLCGIVTIFLGILTIGLNLVAQDFRNMQSGIFIFAVGYAFTKISSRLQSIIYEEKKDRSASFDISSL